MMSIFKSVIFIGCLSILIACHTESSKPETLVRPVDRSSKTPQNTNNPYVAVDVSPMDMSYFPRDYPLNKLNGNEKDTPIMRVIYSRPHLQGRNLFEDIIKYGEPWRLGANEATELNVFKTVYLNHKKLVPGRYTMYCIPHKNEWTIAVNAHLDIWGLKQDSTKDVVRLNIPITHGNPTVEYFTMVFEKTATGADLVIAWDDLLAMIPFTLP